MAEISAQNIGAGKDGFLQPEEVVRNFDLRKGDYAADFGAGHGYLTIPMARIVGGDGRVYAIDIQKDVLEIIKAKARLEHLLNIDTIWADLEQQNGSRLGERFIDFVAIANILFQVENKEAVFKEAQRILREGGRLAAVEWDPVGAESSSGKILFGPPAKLRVKKESVKRWAEEAGLELDREFAAGSHHYGLIFVKK